MELREMYPFVPKFGIHMKLQRATAVLLLCKVFIGPYVFSEIFWEAPAPRSSSDILTQLSAVILIKVVRWLRSQENGEAVTSQHGCSRKDNSSLQFTSLLD